MASTDLILVNGVQMTIGEYKKSKRRAVIKPKLETKKGKKKKEEQTSNLIRLFPHEVDKLMKNISLLKSLSSYYDNGYKQWGNVAKNVINNRLIHHPFVIYRMKMREVLRTIKEIDSCGRRNSKAIYECITKLTYNLDDMRTCINDLTRAISESNVLQQYAKHECINGTQRRLGLKVLMQRSYKATVNIDKAIQRCQQMVGLQYDSYYEQDKFAKAV